MFFVKFNLINKNFSIVFTGERNQYGISGGDKKVVSFTSYTI
jgi:hypothetical protein